ncbi:MAG: hypothetical protein ACK5PQ_03835 [Alphaproteobacteria bacterium]
MMIYWSLALLGFFAFNIPHSFASLQEEQTPKIRSQRVISNSEANDNRKNAAAIKRKTSSKETCQKKSKMEEVKEVDFVDLDAYFWESVSTETDQEIKNPILNKRALEKLDKIAIQNGDNSGYKIGKRFFQIKNKEICAIPEIINSQTAPVKSIVKPASHSLVQPPYAYNPTHQTSQLSYIPTTYAAQPPYFSTPFSYVPRTTNYFSQPTYFAPYRGYPPQYCPYCKVYY